MTPKFYLVGGYVRDRILGIDSKDVDYSVEADSFDHMRQEILNLGGTIFVEKPEFFTIRARIGKVASDFVLCRKDGFYTDGRRPDNVEPGTIYDDLARRDFTMNAIAIDEDDNFIDPFNGITDINLRRIRCVGSPHARFTEDALRMLRAIRFAVTKNFYVDTEIDRFLSNKYSIDLLSHISEDRIREELDRMFRCSTMKTLRYLYLIYPHFGNYLFSKNIWLKPTTEDK